MGYAAVTRVRSPTNRSLSLERSRRAGHSMGMTHGTAQSRARRSVDMCLAALTPNVDVNVCVVLGTWGAQHRFLPQQRALRPGGRALLS